MNNAYLESEAAWYTRRRKDLNVKLTNKTRDEYKQLKVWFILTDKKVPDTSMPSDMFCWQVNHHSKKWIVREILHVPLHEVQTSHYGEDDAL